MADGFKPIYKAEYSIQGSLINEHLPVRINEMMTYIMQLEALQQHAPSACIAWLAAMIPPFKKFFPDYDTLWSNFKECQRLRTEWYSENKGKDFPIKLKDKIMALYTEWWEAYNESGAGIKGRIYVPRDKKIKDAIRRA